LVESLNDSKRDPPAEEPENVENPLEKSEDVRRLMNSFRSKYRMQARDDPKSGVTPTEWDELDNGKSKDDILAKLKEKFTQFNKGDKDQANNQKGSSKTSRSNDDSISE